METQLAPAPDVAAVWYPDNPRVDGSRGNRRSYSSPFPKSAFDVVPQVDLEDKFIPLPLHARDLFDEMLPRELRLRVLSALISLHEADHEQLKKSGKWSVLVASSSKNRWVGRNRAMRELVKLSRVSKLWRTLVFDGQLWQSVDLRAFPAASSNFLASLVELSGPFIKNLDLSGHTYLSPTALIDIAGDLCVRSAPVVNFTYTQLTAITLQGCTALTTQSLHSLLIRSPFLRSLNVKGLQAVTNATFDVLVLCSHLTSLNMSRCINIDGDGVCAFGAAVMARGARLALKELWLCGLAMVDDDTLATLGKAAPHLEVLDLSYCRGLHNSALEAFVSCEDDEKAFGETVSLTSRQAGRDPREWRRYVRRVTALRHLSLSNCIMLTDTACSNLAHSVPRLEFLELAGIGKTLKDDGLVHLLGTTPFIRKLDLEDASDITDAVLEVLTPEPAVEEESPTSSKKTEPPQPGHALEHLTVSCATNLTNDAFKALIRGCSKLRVLEADGTFISGMVLKDFVRQVCERGINDAGLVVVDCRSVGERSVKDMVVNTRPRKGWRTWEARKLGYLDGRDGEELKVGQDECDEKRVVIKSFYSWQTVDAVRHMRERKKKANKKSQSASGPLSEPEDGWKLPGKMRWWPSSRITSGNNTPGEDSDRDGCVVM
ncbi:RNI-like protein [Imleria badia]|nr:RNI-like protein [Imleria badia]